MNKEFLFRALGGVGDDLIHMAQTKRFGTPWKKWVSLAACIVLVVSLGLLTLPYFPIGCGASSEAPDTTEAPAATEEEAPAEDMAQAESTVEEPAEEVGAADGENASETEEEDLPAGEAAGAVQAKIKFVVCGTYYYLDPKQAPAQPPLGEELGVITESDDERLVGCKVYAMPYSAWFHNYAVDGQAVTQCVYVETEEGYLYATTANEKVLARYRFSDVEEAVHSGNTDWLVQEFVQPLERGDRGTIEFTTPAELTSEELNKLFLGTTAMNMGVSVTDYWMTDGGAYEIPVSDVLWRLDRFLDEGYTYAPAETEAYDPSGDGLCYTDAEVYPDSNGLTVQEVQLQQGNILVLTVVRADGSVREYTLRFDEDSWRYVSIVTK